MRRWRVVEEKSLGYGYHLPPRVVGYRYTKGGARRLTALLNSRATKPIFTWERNK